MTEFVTAPTTEYAEIVLTSIPRRGDPATDAQRALADPTNYTHVFDIDRRS